MRHKRVTRIPFVLTTILLLMTAGCAGTPSDSFLERQKKQIRIEYLSSGIPVILQEIPDSPVITVKAVFSGSHLVPPPGKEGLPSLTLSLMNRSTATRDYQEIRSLLYRTSAGLGASGSYPESASLTLTTLTQYFPETYELFEEVLLRPGWDSEEAERLRRDYLMGRQQQENQPFPRTRLIARQNFFKDHPYGTPPGGTLESLQRITLEDMKAFHGELLRRDRLFFSVAGDISSREILESLEKSFGSLQDPEAENEGPAKAEKGVSPTGKAPSVNLAQSLPAGEAGIRWESFPEIKNLAYAVGHFPLPPVDHPDRPALEMAFSLLNDLLFEFVRTRNSACYSVGASLGGGRTGYGSLTIYKTSRPADAVGYTRQAVEALLAGQAVSARISTHNALNPQGTAASGEETTDSAARVSSRAEGGEGGALVELGEVLDFYKQQYVTRFYQRQRSSAAQAGQNAGSWLYWQDPLHHYTRIEEIKALTPADIRGAARRWLGKDNIQWVILTGSGD